MRALIVGAGVGGLGAALGLRAAGHETVVYEQAPDLREGGAAVTLWSNGTGILAELGVSLEGVGARIEVLEQRDHDGRLLLSVDVGRAAAHYGHPHVCLPRRRLLERLAQSVPQEVLRYGRRCLAVEVGEAAITFEGDERETGDVVIGADGRGSAVRQALWDHDPAEATGWVTWQGVTAIPTDITGSARGVMFVGPAGLCGLMPAGEGLLQWWFDQRMDPAASRPSSPLAMLREHFGGWAGPVKDVLDAVSDQDVGFFPHVRHPVPRVWGKGPVTLVGDAAHSFPPTRAQGANQALEDAWALSAVLGVGQGDVAGALRTYERRRSPKAGFVARSAGREDTNKYRPWMTRFMPDGLVSRFYVHWLGRASDYLR